ncbi:MAG: Uncharacterized MFS-type transporter [uncultured Paraburkholderia sp.]|nr:MAG: Uncharacterized MFS-type transporter [uncultured Paraburkholderia sp.]
MLLPSIMRIALQEVAPEKAGLASGVISSTLQIGSAFGTAAISGAWSDRGRRPGDACRIRPRVPAEPRDQRRADVHLHRHLGPARAAPATRTEPRRTGPLKPRGGNRFHRCSSTKIINTFHTDFIFN